MGIQIITDSASDISQERAREMGVTVLPLNVLFGEEEYIDGITISTEVFYDKLENSKGLPRTSQVTPMAYSEAFNKAREAGDDVLCIDISLKLSGCYQSACIARDEMPVKDQAHIRIIDCLQTTSSQYILVNYACRLRDQGLSLDEIVAELDYWKKHVRMIAMLDTLEYLKRGGRISPAKATFGNLLSIKPFVTFEDGGIEIIAKARGAKAALKMHTELIEKYGDIDFTKPVCITYSGSKTDRLDTFLSYLESVYHYSDSPAIALMGSTVGTHAGPGAITIAFFPKDVHPQ